MKTLPTPRSATSVMVWAASVLMLLWAGGPAQAQTILYVDQNASGPEHDGWTWCTAFTDLQDALDVAVWNVVIRAADGTYTPDRGTGNRQSTFQLADSITLEGGYAGCGAPNPDERDVVQYETVLTGDLNGDDVGELGDPSKDENTYHVVTGSGTDATAVIDGFTITAGNANDTNPSSLDRHGGGMYNSGGSPTVSNCLFRANWANGSGGALYNAGPATPFVSACIFYENGSGTGGGMWNEGGAPVISNCLFARNLAVRGGAVFNFSGGSPMLTNCVFAGNSATQRGGGLENAGARVTLTSCTFAGNSAPSGQGLGYSGGDYDLASCILWDGVDEVSGKGSPTITITYSNIFGGWPGEGNIFALPLFVDADGEDNIPGTEDDNLRLLPGSPCIDTGDPSFDPGADATDLDGNPRVVDGDRDGTAIVDMGAYEFQPSDFDGDGDVDLDDFAILADCLAGPGVSTPPGDCTQDQFDVADLDGDDDVDIGDCATFQLAFTAAQP